MIKVGGKQKPYEMWQVGNSLAALPLANFLAGFAREDGGSAARSLARSRIPPAMQAMLLVLRTCLRGDQTLDLKQFYY